MPHFCHPAKVKPTHYTTAENGKWLDWPFGWLSVSALKKQEQTKRDPRGSSTRSIQGLNVYSLCGGITANRTFWRWDCINGFTDGEHANGATTK